LTLSPDCGIDAWGFEEEGQIVSEEFYVPNDLWDSTCPDDEVERWTNEDALTSLRAGSSSVSAVSNVASVGP
jgi:hypothetical protein